MRKVLRISIEPPNVPQQFDEVLGHIQGAVPASWLGRLAHPAIIKDKGAVLLATQMPKVPILTLPQVPATTEAHDPDNFLWSSAVNFVPHREWPTWTRLGHRREAR
ncbi:glycylpeptide N-tetradecanoyltransferase [Colletotrichum scovillei]|uniref:Glycylpeptide N-tetradecanoyltransferase n=1 Tax=Colletotrichum scovillei TaxID=1209932 RepID=A0A9P7UC64_9PEZI|nr:glycylpeptide N-tetradecanoyltransferase [Colletotrichum scovillei]KAG7056302.1 glycylpeptide N-tetradecanoyltransferase [Colletotrichum scovillei]KAG7066231.1 glycylpeptide N-tetradecanoyltransferase [Colletotrichum scovillei]